MKTFFLMMAICSAALAFGARVAVAAPVDVPDTMAERVKPCAACHGLESAAGRDGFYPRLAGKPKGYLFNQLRDFRDGRRYYRPMALLLENLSDEYLMEMASHFADLKQPYPPPEPANLTPGEAALARRLIENGDPARNIPACVECHGKALMGTPPYIPGLLGLPRMYMVAQFGAWRSGGLLRGRKANCMSEIGKQLTAEESNALAAWLASRPMPEHDFSAAPLAAQMAQRCGDLVRSGAER
ncbi:MAG TPA: cytochrome c4 [Nitrosospira sp.]|nr:cytochrome c4 [Nitrosospira sp.]